MKIVCGSCGAKYSIADEKVQGKVFKIRCKKCSNVIVVKGDAQQAESQQQEASEDASMSGAYGGTSGAAEWYVVIDGDQVGPISPEEIEAYFTSGQVGPESFAWRDGLGDWSPLSDLDEFAHLTHDAPGAGDATAVVESPFNDSGSQKEESFNEDATSVMPADDFRAQFEQQDATASGIAAGEQQAGYDDGGGYGDSGHESYGEQGGYADQQPAASAAASDAYAADGGQSSYDGFGGDQSGYDDGAQSDAGYEDDGGYDAGYDDGGSYDDGGYDSYGDDADSNEGMFASFDSGADGGDSGYDGFGGGYDDAGAQEPAPDTGAQAANDMIGQRSENSVLFSLSSLDQVGAVSSSDAPAQSDSGGAPQANAGGPPTEGSGLIDIQALASAHKVMKGSGGGGAGGAGPVAGPGGDGADDPFGAGTMSMPALMPMGSHKSNKGLIIGLSIGGIVLLGALGAVGYLFMSKDDTPQQPQEKVVYVEKESDDKKEEGDSQDDEAKKEEAAAAAKAVEEGDSDAKEGEEGEGEDEETPEKSDEEKEAAKKDDDNGSRKSTSKSTSSSRRGSSSKTTSSGGSDSKSNSDSNDIDNLLDGIGKKDDDDSSKSGSSRASAVPKKDVPKSLSRNMVRDTVRKWDGRVKNCYRTQNRNKMGGKVFVKYTVQPSGRVSSASVTTGKFKGTDVGTCVQRVVKSMKFPQAQTSMTITYPFSLN